MQVIVTEAGIRFPGYLSDGTFGGEPIKFADVPGGTLASMMAIPPLGWAQIVCSAGRTRCYFRICKSFPFGPVHSLMSARLSCLRGASGVLVN